MESSLAYIPVHDSGARHITRTQPQSLLQNTPQTLPQTQIQTQPPLVAQVHPSKRRRANSGNQPTSPTADLTTLSAPTNWRSPYTPALDALGRPFDPSILRASSPGQASRVSRASDQSSGPQLRKKPKSSSIKDNNILRVTSITINNSSGQQAFTLPVQPGAEATRISATDFGNTALSVSRANSGSSQHQSPIQKRPPASHSSYGVETTCGPPPSYTTQRTLSQERIRKVDRNSQSRMQSSSSEQGQFSASNDTYDTQKKESAPSLTQSSPATTDTYSIPTPTEADNMANIGMRGERQPSADEEPKASSSDERKSEDLFLNIARHDAARAVPQRTEKRRSRISIPFLPNNRQSQAIRSSPTHPQFESRKSEVTNSHRQRASLGGQVSAGYPVRSHVADRGRLHEQSAELISDTERNEDMDYPTLRRASTTNTESNRLVHRSSAGFRSSRLASESMSTDRPKTEEQIATESTISTTAPSTVWDELDDLKYRIRKLELTGKLPASSAAAMVASDRPRTATTAATTMSTSPQYKSPEPNLQSPIEGVPSNIHPLLHEALGNARAVISPDIYQKLEATAQDALQLAAMMSNDTLNSGSYATPLSNERQIRRRTESMCRGLTELAIALAVEAKPTQSTARPASRDQSLPPNSMLRSRRYSNDPSDRSQVYSRVQSRLDNRRTSVHLGRNGTGYSSPEHGQYQQSGPVSQASDPRINRSSTLLRKRGQGSFDGTDDQYDASPSVRPGSRAMTDLGAYRHLTRSEHVQSSPREYTSQHPLPTPQEQEAVASSINTPLPNSGSSSFMSRRKYASPTSVVSIQNSGPVTPREAWGRISMVPVETQSPDVVSEAGGFGRVGSSRRSLGLAGRIGSSVGSRLRSARAEKPSREGMDSRGQRDVAPSAHGDHATHPINAGMYQYDRA